MSTIREQVTEFHRAMGQPIADKPAIPSDERVRLRLRLIAEEFCELLDSCLGKPSAFDHEAWQYWNYMGCFAEYINKAPVHVSLYGATDALADLAYVIEGTNLEFGINGEAVLEEVHAANMAKVPDPNGGKVRKPEGWVGPDIERVLAEQGWGEPSHEDD